MPTIRPGHTTWSMVRDTEGYREYKITYFVDCLSTEGPALALQTPGLPRVGSPWVIDNDLDLWVWCRPNCTVTPEVTDEPNTGFALEFTFSNKPPEPGKQRCQDTTIENPLLEPNKISGGFSDINREATEDYLGNPLLTSSFERLRGPQVEFDDGNPNVLIEQNVYPLGIETFAPMIKTVNSAPLWGHSARCVKLNKVTWEEKYLGSCTKYFTRKLEFEIDPNTFDRDVLDEGTKVLNGYWEPTSGYWVLRDINGSTPNYLNPSHYIKAVDYQGNPMKIVLNGRGVPADAVVQGTGALGTGTYETDPGYIHVAKYGESDFLVLGIPLIIGW